ncbi:MAG TPA: oligosaccharide flippase family protein, partial [Methanocorpusculum sp.]|nr:oligosaccharide flippase family protein [Methanocorpusculum sp.]
MTESFRLTLIKSFLWKFLEARAIQIITLVYNIIVARFLLPEAFGTVAILTAIFYLMQTLIDEGLCSALIQKRTIDEVEESSVFYLQLAAAAVLYAVLFFISPAISEFYQVGDMTLYLRVTGLFIFFYAFQSIQYVFINREFKFRKYFFCSLASSLIAGGFAICMAVNGCGIWSIVLEEGVYAASLTLILWFAVIWRPKLVFSWEKVKKLYAFGWRVLLASLAIRLSSTSLIGGKFFSTVALGNFTTGEIYPKTIARCIYEPVETVAFPAIAKCQDAKETRIKLMHYILICNAFLLFPLMGGLAAMAEPLVHLLLGENWTGIIFFIQVFTLVYAATPMMYLNLQTIKGLGKGGKYLFAQMLSFVLVILVFV